MKASERFSFDDEADLVVIDGRKFSMQVIEGLILQPTTPGFWFRIDSVGEESVTVRQMQTEVSQ